MRIGIVADTHLADRATAFRDNWEAARACFAARAVDLIVHLGDISADGATAASDLAEAAACFEGLSRVRFLPGNHDIGDNPVAPGAAPSDHPLDPARLADYRRLFGADRWTMRPPGWQVIGLNAQLFGTGTQEEEEQFAWLAAELAAEPAAALGLMLHKPLFRDGPADTEAHVRYVPAAPRARLLALLARRDLRFVLSGHAHQSRRISVDGVEHVWAPSAAFRIPDAMQEAIGVKRVGVLLLDLAEKAHSFEDITPPQMLQHDLLDHAEVYPAVAAIRSRLQAAG